MSSLLKISVSFYFFILSLSATGGTPYGISAGAGEAGMGYACIMKEGFWSAFHNQALLALNNSLIAGISYENRFGINELSTRTAGFVIPSGHASAGAAYSHFGYRDFSRDMAGLACGLKLSGNISAGVQINYFSEKTSGEYYKDQCITIEAGLIVAPSGNIKLGLHIFNPVPNTLRKISRPASVRAGAGIKLSSILFAGLEADMQTGTGMAVRTGFEYEAVRDLCLRTGYSTRNNSFCFGMGYRYRMVILDLGFTTHERLGVSSSVSLTFIIR